MKGIMRVKPKQIEVMEYKNTGNGCTMTPIWTVYQVKSWRDDGPRIAIDKRSVKPIHWRYIGQNDTLGAAFHQIKPDPENDVKSGESIGEWLVRMKETRRLTQSKERIA